MSQVFDRARIVAIAVIAAILLAPIPIAFANGLPQSQLWLEFDYQTSEQPDLEGVQLIGCDTDECSQPLLIDQYGTCDSPGCVQDSSPSVFAMQNLNCLAGRCVMVFAYLETNGIDPTFLKVVGQFSDRVRESDVSPNTLEVGGGAYGWRIAVQDTALSVSDYDPDAEDGNWFNSGFLQSFLLTVAVESLVAVLVLRAWLDFWGDELLSGLGYVLLANLISYPVTWTLWPSLRQFQPAESRLTAYFLLLFAGLLTALIAHLTRKQGTSLRRRVILTLALLLVTIAMILVWLLAMVAQSYAGSGSTVIFVPGLPAGLTVALAEIFAVAFEALLLYLLARRTLGLALKQAGVISLAMNATSFVLSLVISALL